MMLFGASDPIAEYHSQTETSWDDGTPVDDLRYVVLDCETTGVDARRDRIVSIGGIRVEEGDICLGETFDRLIRQRWNTASVVVHGVTAEAATRLGVEETEALRDFLGWLGNSVIVGHHIGFDVQILSNACQARFGFPLKNRWIDTMNLTLHLEREGMLAREGSSEPWRDFSLDGLCQRFRVAPHDRHTASGDAFITAQIFIRLLRLARRTGRHTLGKLAEAYEER